MDESISVLTQVDTDDHHYPHLTGYFLAYYTHLEPAITAEEFEAIVQISCFAFTNDRTTHAGVAKIAKRIASGSDKPASWRRILQLRLRSLEAKGYIVINERRDPSKQYVALHHEFDLRPIFKACKLMAIDDGWFTEEAQKSGETHYPRESRLTTPVNPDSPETNNINQKEKDSILVDATHTTVATPEIQSSKPLKESTAPKPSTPKPTLIVNQTNAALGRTRPPNFTEEDYQAWLRAKPVWELFCYWQIWNITGKSYEHYSEYQADVHPEQWKRVVSAVAMMGKWLDTLAKKTETTLTYEWVLSWKRWYCDTVMVDDIDKYPTKQETFEKNFILYINHLYQLAKGNEHA